MIRLERNYRWFFDGEDVEEAVRMIAASDCRNVFLKIRSDRRHKNLDFLLELPEISTLSVILTKPIDVTAIGKMKRLKSLFLMMWGGFKNRNPEFLSGLQEMSKLTIYSPGNFDVAVIKGMKKLESLSLNMTNWSGQKHLNFLLELPEISSLYIGLPKGIDASAIGKLENLKSLHLDPWDNISTGFELDRLHVLESLALHLGKTGIVPEASMPQVRKLYLGRYKGVDLGFLNGFPFVQNFILSFASKLTDIGEIEACQNINKLSINYCPRLQTIDPLKTLAKLQELDMDCLRNLSSINPVFKIDSIRKFDVDRVSPVKSLKSVVNWKDLEFFRFTGSETLDGDLQFFLEMPKLDFFCISPNKKHYRPTASHIYKTIEARRPK